MIVFNFLQFFCEQIETAQEEQDSIRKIKACVEEQSNSGKVNLNLILFTKTRLSGSFFRVCTDFVFAILFTFKWDLLTTIDLLNQKILIFLGTQMDPNPITDYTFHAMRC